MIGHLSPVKRSFLVLNENKNIRCRLWTDRGWLQQEPAIKHFYTGTKRPLNSLSIQLGGPTGNTSILREGFKKNKKKLMD